MLTVFYRPTPNTTVALRWVDGQCVSSQEENKTVKYSCVAFVVSYVVKFRKSKVVVSSEGQK